MDLVICTDVLEHIPEDELDKVLKDIFYYSERVIFTIALTPANICLPNGDNAHCTVMPEEWWIKQLLKYTNTVNYIERLTLPNLLSIKTF